MEQAVDAYDTTVKTGNPALDVLLTEKNQICRANRSALPAWRMERALPTWNLLTWYALFGNALENALRPPSS